MVTAAGWLGLACLLALACCVFLFPILAIFRRYRRFAGYGYLTSSFVLGGSLWIVCAMTVFDAWGSLALWIGVLMFGVGVLPMTLIIYGLASKWVLFAEFIAIGGVAVGTRMLGYWLMQKS